MFVFTDIISATTLIKASHGKVISTSKSLQLGTLIFHQSQNSFKCLNRRNAECLFATDVLYSQILCRPEANFSIHLIVVKSRSFKSAKGVALIRSCYSCDRSFIVFSRIGMYKRDSHTFLSCRTLLASLTFICRLINSLTLF